MLQKSLKLCNQSPKRSFKTYALVAYSYFVVPLFHNVSGAELVTLVRFPFGYAAHLWRIKAAGAAKQGLATHE